MIDKKLIENIHQNIAVSLENLLLEIDISGEETTGDETSLLIEQYFGHIGRLWIAEYLNTGTNDEVINKLLYDFLRSNVTTGQWVLISRTIKNYFINRKLNTFLDGLIDEDFGSQNDNNSDTSKLIHYRNLFSHGSLEVTLKEIKSSRRLIFNKIKKAKFLQNIIYIKPNLDLNYTKLGLTNQTVKLPKDLKVNTLQPFFINKTNKILNLYPLFIINGLDNKSFELKFYSLKDSKISIDSLFERETLKIWFERYENERLGNIESFNHVMNSTKKRLNKTYKTKFYDFLENEKLNMLVIKSYPGFDKITFIKEIFKVPHSILSKRKIDHVNSYVVKKDGLSMSSYTFTRFIISQIELTLKKAKGYYFINNTDHIKALDNGLKDLKDKNRYLLIGIENLHIGENFYLKENMNIIDIYNLLVKSNVILISTIYTGAIKSKFFYDDEIFNTTIPEKNINQKELEVTLDGLKNNLIYNILKCFEDTKSYYNLFDICDLFEKKYNTNIFEPKLEREIFDHIYLFYEKNNTGNHEKSWKLFTPLIKKYLRS